MHIDGVSAIAVILIASFAVDRIVKGVTFGLSFVRPWVRWFPDPNAVDEPAERAIAARNQKLGVPSRTGS